MKYALSSLVLCAVAACSDAPLDTSAADTTASSLTDSVSGTDTGTPGASADSTGPDSAGALDAVAADTDPGPGDDVTIEAPDASESVPDTEPGDALPPEEDTTVPVPTLALCTGGPFQAPPKVDFEHLTTTLVLAAGNPEHSAQDVIALPGSASAIPGKFAYGVISKDLEDEQVEVFIDRCAGWESLGTQKTNSDGRTSRALDASETADVGVYAVRQVVLGDASVVESTLRVLPAGTKLVVFDIDGTLTTSDEELFKDAIADFFEPIFGGTYVPTAYADATTVTQTWQAKGYVLLFMTGRPYWLTRITREWLKGLGFADASLHVTDSNAEALPTEGGVGTYKAEYLKALLAMGYQIEVAYGNATTDIYAYAQAGIPKERTFIIGTHAGEEGTQALEGGYTSHLTWVATQPDAQQPFTLP